MKYEFLSLKDYDYTDKSIPHFIEAPEGYRPFAVTRQPGASQGIEFWFIREHAKGDRRIKHQLVK